MKAFCSGSPIGNIAVMRCAYDDGTKENVLHFSVPLSSEGVEILNDWDAMGMRGTGSNSIKFKDVFVPEEKVNLIRDRGVWHPVWNVVGTLAFPVFISPYVGVAEAIAEKAKNILSGRPNTDANTHSILGKMQNHLQIVKWARDDMVQRVNDFNIKPSEDSAMKALQSKSIISHHGRACAQSAMEAIGGYSYFKKVQIERLYRDLLAGEFHPMQAHKQEAALGEFMMTGKL
jgi:alkylation response protein AidB-like acyl-CoA dehydrogenase